MRTALRLAIAICALLLSFSVLAQRIEISPAIGVQPFVVRPQSGTDTLYIRSAALVVSASKYPGGAAGWSPLPATESEMDAVRDELVRQGFEVTRVYDPTALTLYQQMQAFLGKYGDQPNIRLLFFYSGHGHTNDVNKMSYIVPIDAGNHKTDYPNFISKSTTLESFHTWMRQFKALHFMAVFDSCFSGAVFTTKSSSDAPDRRPLGLDDRWRYLTDVAKKPVRQFISAGGAGEQLPGESQFVPVFLEGLRGGASINKDGYVSGKELGVFIERVVSTKRAGKQNPHSGVSNDTNFIFGDMVFQYAANNSTAQVVIPSPTKSTTKDYRNIPGLNLATKNVLITTSAQLNVTEGLLTQKQTPITANGYFSLAPRPLPAGQSLHPDSSLTSFAYLKTELEPNLYISVQAKPNFAAGTIDLFGCGVVLVVKRRASALFFWSSESDASSADIPIQINFEQHNTFAIRQVGKDVTAFVNGKRIAEYSFLTEPKPCKPGIQTKVGSPLGESADSLKLEFQGLVAYEFD
jgi:hypothetical protein